MSPHSPQQSVSFLELETVIIPNNSVLFGDTFSNKVIVPKNTIYNSAYARAYISGPHRLNLHCVTLSNDKHTQQTFINMSLSKLHLLHENLNEYLFWSRLLPTIGVIYQSFIHDRPTKAHKQRR